MCASLYIESRLTCTQTTMFQPNMESNTKETVQPESNQPLDLNFNLLNIIGSVWRWRKWILILSGGVVVGTIIVSLFLSNYYTAEATIIPGNEEKDLFESSGKNNSIYGDEDAVERAVVYAKSAPLVDYMIQEFDLAKRYGINNETPKGKAKVAKRFLKLYRVKKNEHIGIEISMQDTDPEMAAKMTNAALSKMESLYKEATVPSKALILKTYENALASKKRELEVVSDSLIRLRKKHSIYDIKTQGEVLAALIVSTESTLVEHKAKLEAFKLASNRQDSIININARVQGLKRKLEMLTNENDSIISGISIKSYNEGREKVMYFENQIESLNKDISKILTEYTQFKAQASSDMSALIILEPVQVPREKSFPVRSLMVIAALFLSLIVGIMAAMILDLNKRIDWKNVLKDREY